ncbi:unnamed protein product, partial [Allacma fusca]
MAESKVFAIVIIIQICVLPLHTHCQDSIGLVSLNAWVEMYSDCFITIITFGENYNLFAQPIQHPVMILQTGKLNFERFLLDRRDGHECKASLIYKPNLEVEIHAGISVIDFWWFTRGTKTHLAVRHEFVPRAEKELRRISSLQTDITNIDLSRVAILVSENSPSDQLKVENIFVYCFYCKQFKKYSISCNNLSTCKDAIDSYHQQDWKHVGFFVNNAKDLQRAISVANASNQLSFKTLFKENIATLTYSHVLRHLSNFALRRPITARNDGFRTMEYMILTPRPVSVVPVLSVADTFVTCDHSIVNQEGYRFLIKPFDPFTWYTLLACASTLLAIQYCIGKCRDCNAEIFQIISILLENYFKPGIIPSGIKRRILYTLTITWTFVSIILGNAYKGVLTSELTAESKIDPPTFNDLFKHNFSIYNSMTPHIKDIICSSRSVVLPPDVGLEGLLATHSRESVVDYIFDAGSRIESLLLHKKICDETADSFCKTRFLSQFVIAKELRDRMQFPKHYPVVSIEEEVLKCNRSAWLGSLLELRALMRDHERGQNNRRLLMSKEVILRKDV